MQVRALQAGAPDLGVALAAFAHLPRLAALDSSGGEPRQWSVLALAGEELRGAPHDLAGLRQSLEWAGVLPSPGRPEGWPDELAEAPFCGGFLGALGYELGAAGEPAGLPREPWSHAPIEGLVVRDFLVWHHPSERAWLVLDAEGDVPVERREHDVLARLHGAPPRLAVLAPAGPLVRHTPGFVHRARVEALRRWIRSGDVYQANLAHRFTRAMTGHPVALHLALRRGHPVPYGGYLTLAPRGGQAGGVLTSHSPELLLRAVGDHLHVRPIKGTAPRSPDPDRDAQLARDLVADPKERAELAMIVDLVRNDLGRVAEVGSVVVERFPELESYAGVHHLMADVRARRKPGLDALHALHSVFPASSITGAPKLAAMECIAALEREGRGFFTGSFGFLSNDGSACFNVLIRSLLWRPRADLGAKRGEVSLRVGGGITWGSKPALEDEETLHKARHLLAALEGEGP